MKKLLIILFVCFGFIAKAQVFTPMTAAGYQNKRTKTDSTNYIPTFPGYPTLRSTVAQKQAAIAADSTNKLFYWYDPKTETWNVLGSGSGSTINIFNDTTILICSGTNNCDTFITNVTANYVSILNDSTLIVCNTEGACDTININPTNFGVSVVSFTKNATGDSIILTLSDNTRLAVKDSLGVGISTINIITDSSISICNFNSCDTFITTVNPQLVTILNDSTLLVCDTTNTCDTLHIPRTQFIQNLFDTTNIYNQIQNVYNYFSDTSFTNQFFPKGDGVLLDTVIRITDSTLRFIYTDGTQVEDTFRIALTQENITNITNIINYIDSLRGNDTTFILSASNLQSGLKALYSTTDSLSGNDTLHLEFPHNNIAEDSVLTTDVDGDLKMKLVTSGTGGGIDSVRQTIATDSIKEYSGGVGTMAVRAQRVFNVKDNYGGLGGAKGDGTTDDTRAIQAAINAAYAAQGGKVYFPNGVYKLADTLSTTYTFSGGIRYGGGNAQLYIPDNQTPFQTHPLVNIEFVGESAPNMFISRLVPYPLNRSGVIIYSTITGSGTNPAILCLSGDAWAFGNINDAQISIKNINFRVKANISASGPTMGALNLQKASTIGYIENVLCDIDTASYYAVKPVANTFGIWMPYANNSAFCPINNSIVTGYKYGFIFSEHSEGDNLIAGVCEYGYVFTQAPHASHFGRLGSNWNTYSIANGTPISAGLTAYVGIDQLDIEQDTVASSWTKNRYVVYDSTNHFIGDVTYHNTLRGMGPIEANFNKLGGANANFQLRYIGSYPDTTTRFTGFATLAKVYNDSVAIRAAIPAQFNPSAGAGISLTGSYPNITFTNSAVGGTASNVFTKFGSDSLRAYAPSIYRIGVGLDTGYSRFSIANPNVGATMNDTLGLMLIDTTQATVGAQKYSPPIVFSGNGWKTTATAASQNVRFREYVVPVQGSTNPSGTWTLESSINGGAYANPVTLTSTGTFTVSALVANSSGNFSNGTLTAGTTNINSFATITATSLATTPSERLVLTNATAATSGVPVQYSPTFKIEGRGWTGAASQLGAFAMEVRPVNGTSPITANWVLKSNINAAGYNDRITVGDGGAVRFHFYGAGTATFDASGNITSVSDERLKNIQGFYKSGLKELMNIKPITYKWNKKSGNEMEHTYAGFSAQNVKANIPLGTGEDSKGYLSLQDRAIIATLVNAVKEQQQEIEDLKKEIDRLKKP